MLPGQNANKLMYTGEIGFGGNSTLHALTLLLSRHVAVSVGVPGFCLAMLSCYMCGFVTLHHARVAFSHRCTCISSFHVTTKWEAS